MGSINLPSLNTPQKVGNTIKSGVQKAGGAIKKGIQKAGGAIKAGAQKVKQGFETAGRVIKMYAPTVAKWFEGHIHRRPVSCGQSGQIRPCSRAA